MSIRTPQRQHEKEHRRPDVPLADCWQCQRERAKCRSKRRFETVTEAHDESIAVNIETDWMRMLAPYPCPWCRGYHHTKARPGTARWKRVEKRRRRWLTAQREMAS